MKKAKAKKRVPHGYVYEYNKHSTTQNKRNPFRAYFKGKHVGYYETEAKAWAAINKRIEGFRK